MLRSTVTDNGTRVPLAARITAPGDASEKEPGPVSMSARRPGVLYVDLNTLTDSEFTQYFAVMHKAKTIIAVVVSPGDGPVGYVLGAEK